MSQYIVSARKYRPDSFETLIGQDTIARTLKNSILSGHLAHAYLFCGPRGVGKTSTARIFAKTINCSNPSKDMEPCGECESCVSFQEGRSYCIHELDAASNNGVDDIKGLMDQVQIPPQVGRYSVYIIDEVHMLSTAAFNAFLKTLEEPPAHAIFILATTEKHKILPTILSRCETYDFNRITIPDMVRNLRSIATKEEITVDDESLHVIAQKADGAMRDALTIFDQTVAFCGNNVNYQDVIKNLNVLDYEYSFRLVESFLKKDYSAALLEFNDILSKGFNALYFVSALSAHLRDLIVTKSGGAASLLELPDSLKERYLAQAAQCSLKYLYDALTVTMQCESGYKASVSPRLYIEYALMRLSFLDGVPASGPTVAPPVAEPVVPQVSVPAAPSASATAPAAAPTASAPAAPSPEPSEPSKLSEPSEPKPRARRSVAKINSSISISEVLNPTEKASKASAADNSQEDEGKLPDDDTLKASWLKLSERYSSRPRLANTIANAGLEIKEEDGSKVITFKVQNESQQKWIQEKLLRDLESSLCEIAGSKKLKLTVSVVPDTEVKAKPYMPEDKAKELMKKNDDVKNLVKDFDLDINN
ncbi:MAG: DNA polymerase III subunit gamma/tau [Bacteroidales bacterium]